MEEKIKISRDELVKMTEALCYEHYMTKFEEFITDGRKCRCAGLYPADREKISKDFEDFMKYNIFKASEEEVKEYAERYKRTKFSLSERIMHFFAKNLW